MISQSKDTQRRHKRNAGVVYPWVADKTVPPVNVMSQSFPFSHSSTLILLFSSSSSAILPPSVFHHFQVSFIVARHKGAFRQTKIFLQGPKIQHLQAMHTSVDFAKAWIIKVTLFFCSLPLRIMNAFFWFHNPSLFALSLPLSHPTFCPHLLLFLAAPSL